jgi:hypothetical protein
MLPLAMSSNRLPTENAFLVQLAEEVDPALGELAGRIEHLGSGLRARFDSSGELLALFARMLAQRRGATGNPNLEER